MHSVTVVLPDVNYGNSLDDSYCTEMPKAALLFFVINNFLFLFFHKHNIISKIKQNKTADTYSTSQGSIKREGESEGQQEHKSYSFK